MMQYNHTPLPMPTSHLVLQLLQLLLQQQSCPLLILQRAGQLIHCTLHRQVHKP